MPPAPPQPGAPQQEGPVQYGPPQQGPYQQPYGQQPPPPPQYQQEPYEQPPYPQQPYPPQQYPPQQPYPEQQYSPQQQPYPPEQYPQQTYQPGPNEQQQYAPPPYEQYPPQQGYPPPPGQVPPYQPAPYEQYPPYQQPPPYEPAPPYEQQYQPQFDEQFPPAGQHHPGQADYYDQPPPPEGGSWVAPPTPQSDQIGTPMPAPEGDSVFRRFRRIASEAAGLIGASGRVQRDVDNIATIRRPIAIMRRVGVLSPVTNGGTSTVTALLSTMLTAQRPDRVVAIDADPGGAELSRRLEVSLGAGPIEGVTLVRSEGNADAVRSTLAEVQGQGSRDVGLALVDCPGSMYDEIGTAMASSAHCTVLVVPSVPHVAEYCLAQLDQLTPAGQDVLLTRGVVVITVVENVDPGAVGWLADAFRQRGLEPIVLPYDAHIANAWPMHTEELQSETRRAVLDLAARVVDTVTRTAS